MQWECSEGHKWWATGNNVKLKGTWCNTCAGMDKIGLEKLRLYAKEKGGLLLSTEYVNRRGKLLWQCEFGHKWESSACIAHDGAWCPQCSGNKKLTLNDLQKVARDRKGKLLSNRYVNIDSMYKWQCSQGHEWESNGDSVKNKGSWCPKCSQNHFKEDIIRAHFEAIFNAEFPKRRPKWLRNSSGNLMELDGFNEDLSIAFEYNGVQHYEKNYFIDSDEKLSKRIEDDKQKRILCKDKNIALFVVHYKLNPEDYKKNIIEFAEEYGKVKLLNKDAHIDLNYAYLTSDYLTKLKEFVKEKNGILYDKYWKGFAHKYKFKCLKHNLIFHQTGNILYKRSWCRKCGYEDMVNTINLNRKNELLKYASYNRATLISKKYTGQFGTYEFRCEKGHLVKIIWKGRKKRKSFCRTCRELLKQRNFIENSRKLHGDKYDYSKVVYNKYTEHVKIICPIHGEFMKTPRRHIGQTAGCPKCSRLNRK